MTSPINQIQEPFDTTTTFAPTPSLISKPDRSTRISARFAVRQLKQWQEELEYKQKEIGQILLLYKLYLNHEIQHAKMAAKALQNILNQQVAPLLEQLDQIEPRHFKKGTFNSSFIYKDQYIDLQKQLKEVRIKIRPLKSCILEAMLDTLPLTIM